MQSLAISMLQWQMYLARRICNGYDTCGDNSNESKLDGALCGMLNYFFAIAVYIIVSGESKTTKFSNLSFLENGHPLNVLIKRSIRKHFIFGK